MSLNVLFINETLVKSRTAISDSIDGKQIKPLIKLAQDKYILPALGSGLYKRLQDGIEIGNLSQDERNLLDNYIAATLLWFTIGEMVVGTSFQFFSKGVMQKGAEESNNPGKGQLELLERKYISNGEFYKQRLIDYLRENSTMFEQYLQYGSGFDAIAPQIQAYTSPIYLGRRGARRKVSNLDLPYNYINPYEDTQL
jgi:hypothetical protein